MKFLSTLRSVHRKGLPDEAFYAAVRIKAFRGRAGDEVSEEDEEAAGGEVEPTVAEKVAEESARSDASSSDDVALDDSVEDNLDAESEELRESGAGVQANATEGSKNVFEDLGQNCPDVKGDASRSSDQHGAGAKDDPTKIVVRTTKRGPCSLKDAVAAMYDTSDEDAWQPAVPSPVAQPTAVKTKRLKQASPKLPDVAVSTHDAGKASKKRYRNQEWWMLNRPRDMSAATAREQWTRMTPEQRSPWIAACENHNNQVAAKDEGDMIE